MKKVWFQIRSDWSKVLTPADIGSELLHWLSSRLVIPAGGLKLPYYQVHVLKFGVFCKYYRLKCLSVCWGCRISLHDCRRALLTGLQRCEEEEQQGISKTIMTFLLPLHPLAKAITLQRLPRRHNNKRLANFPHGSKWSEEEILCLTWRTCCYLSVPYLYNNRGL